MTNVESKSYTRVITEVSVPSPATARDLRDLVMFADRKYREIHGTAPEYDDAYTVEAEDDRIVATIDSPGAGPEYAPGFAPLRAVVAVAELAGDNITPDHLKAVYEAARKLVHG